MTRAVVLAAGRGARFGLADGESFPKAMLQIDGRPVIWWAVESLKTAGLDNVVIVRGRNARAIPDFGCQTIDRYAPGNMVRSLMLATRFFDDEIVVVYGDLLFEPRLVTTVLSSGDCGVSVVVDTEWRELYGERVADPYSIAESCRIGTSGELLEVGGVPATPANTEAQYVGILRFTKASLREVVRWWQAASPEDSTLHPYRDWYMTDLLTELIAQGWAIRAVPVKSGWFEFDTPQDYRVGLRLCEKGMLQRFVNLEALR